MAVVAVILGSTVPPACSLVGLEGFSGGGTADDAAVPLPSPDAAVDATTDAGAEADSQPDGSSSYVDVVLEDAPSSYYRLDEDVGPSVHDFMKRHDGTYRGAIAFGAPGALGAGGNPAVRFPAGADPVIDLGKDFAFADGAPFTIEMWVASTADIDAGVYHSILAKSASSPAGYQGYELIENRGTFRWLFEGAGGLDPIVPGSPGYNHFVVTYDTVTLTLYLNANVVSTRTLELRLTAAAASFFAGNNAAGQGNPMSGSLDELAFYPRALSSARIRAHFDAARAR